MSDEDPWLGLQGAVARVSEYTGLSIGAAQIVLHKVCSSGEVRSRGANLFNFGSRGKETLLPLLSAHDWQGNSINLDKGELEGPGGMFGIMSVTVSAADLEWWLRNRWKPASKVGSGVMPTGAPGAPSKGMHLIVGELKRRVRENACKASLREEATELLQWFRLQHPNAQSPTIKTIENNIRDHHRQWRARQSPAEA